MENSIKCVTSWLDKENVKYEYIRNEEQSSRPSSNKPKEIANLIFLNVEGNYKQALLSEGYEVNNNRLREVLQTKKLNVLCYTDEQINNNDIDLTIIDKNLLIESAEIFLKTPLESQYLRINAA